MNNYENKLALFQSKFIRRVWHDNEWWFSVVDVVGALTNQSDFQMARKYWNKLSERLRIEGNQSVTKCHQLKLGAADGKKYLTDVANTETLLRLIQSIPSPKAEPFKLWLAQVGKERLDEIQNPELAQERMKQLYEKKGYSKAWIDKRLRGIAVRQGLTDEWKERGLTHEKDFAILTSEITKATFGMTPAQYRKFKNIPKKSKENLRDNMTDLELIFTMLGEKVTTEISNVEKPKAMSEHKKIARRGGNVAGNAREQTEKELGRSVISKENALSANERKKLG